MTRIDVCILAICAGGIVWIFGTIITEALMSRFLRVIQWLKKHTK